MKNYKLEEKIKDYIINPRDAIINFELACSYYDIQQICCCFVLLFKMWRII